MSTISLEHAGRVHVETEKNFGDKEDQTYYFASGMEVFSQTHGVKFVFECKFPSGTMSSLLFKVRAETKVIRGNKVEMKWASIADHLRESDALRFARRFACLWGSQEECKKRMHDFNQKMVDDDKTWPNINLAEAVWLCQTNAGIERELLKAKVPEDIAKRCASKNICHSKKKSKSTWLLGAYWRAAECQEKLKKLWESQNFSRCLHCQGSASLFSSVPTVWKAVPGFPYTMRLYCCMDVNAEDDNGDLRAQANPSATHPSGPPNPSAFPDHDNSEHHQDMASQLIGGMGGGGGAGAQQPALADLDQVNKPTMGRGANAGTGNMQGAQKLVPLLLEPKGNYLEDSVTWVQQKLLLCPQCAYENQKLNDELANVSGASPLGNAGGPENLGAKYAGSSFDTFIESLRREQTRKCLRRMEPAGANNPSKQSNKAPKNLSLLATATSTTGGSSESHHHGDVLNRLGDDAADKQQGGGDVDDGSQERAHHRAASSFSADLLNGQITLMMDELTKALRHHMSFLLHQDGKYTEFQKMVEICDDGTADPFSNTVVDGLMYIVSRYLQEYHVTKWTKYWQNRSHEYYKNTGAKIDKTVTTKEISDSAARHCNPLWFFLFSLTLSRRQNTELKRIIDSDSQYDDYLESRRLRRVRALGLLQNENAAPALIVESDPTMSSNQVRPTMMMNEPTMMMPVGAATGNRMGQMGASSASADQMKKSMKAMGHKRKMHDMEGDLEHDGGTDEEEHGGELDNIEGHGDDDGDESHEKKKMMLESTSLKL